MGRGRERQRWRAARWCMAILGLTLSGSVAEAWTGVEADSLAAGTLAQLSLEQLMQVQITSVSKKQEPQFGAAAAVYTVTAEDIRRAGVHNIPDALRMVPGVDVAQLDANKWAVSTRGFNDRFSNKLLVMVDGRSVYTPLFSGVYWEMQNIPLADIDRIEVVRGPGDTLGANAVNGIINIITKPAAATTGGLMAAGSGTIENGFGMLRYGAATRDDLAYRVSVQYADRGAFETPAGGSGADQWQNFNTSFRLDAGRPETGSLALHGSMYRGRADQSLDLVSLAPPFTNQVHDQVDFAGGYLLGCWTRQSSGTSQTAIQVYYDGYSRSDAVYSERRRTLDLDLQHGTVLASRHALLWGIGLRQTQDVVEAGPTVHLAEPNRTDHLVSAFVQDDVTLARRRLKLSFGTKLEQNNISGFEIQPSARALWTHSPRQVSWTAVARAVRTPSRAEVTARVDVAAFPDPRGIPVVMTAQGNSAFGPEQLLAWEAGHRLQVANSLSFDVATFLNQYRDLRVGTLGTAYLEGPPTSPWVVQPLIIGNGQGATTLGVEFASTWSPRHNSKLLLNYTFFRDRRSPLPETGVNIADDAGPQHQLHLRSYTDLPHALEFDWAAYYVGRVPSKDIPAYTRLDLRLGWRPVPQFDLSLGAQNLLHRRDSEGSSTFGEVLTVPPASFYTRLALHY